MKTMPSPGGETLKRTKRLTIGIDLGGTKIATGLVDDSGKILAADRRPSKSPDHASLMPKQQIRFCVDSMADAVVAVLASAPGKTAKQKSGAVQGVGLAAAGPLNVDKGLIVNPSNFTGWGTVPIVRLLTEALKKRGVNQKVYFQNDAIAAALGEGWTGRAKRCTSYAMITLGTGIGTGVILNGRPAQSKGMGSEWGHSIVNRAEFEDEDSELDPYQSTVEGIASGTGMIRFAHHLGFEGPSTVELAAAARDNDDLLAKYVFKKASFALAALFHNLSVGFHLDIIVVTGGLLPIQDLFVPRAVEIYGEWIKRTAPDFKTSIVISKLGNNAGVVGAARLPRLS